MQRPRIIVRGEAGIAECVLADADGHRAARACVSGYEVVRLLSGWNGEFGCDADFLFDRALGVADPTVAETLDRWSVQSQRRSDVRFMSPGSTKRMLELARHAYRPREIVALKNEIAVATRVAEQCTSKTGLVDMDQVRLVVGLKCRLDGLYGEWLEGGLD